MAISIKVVVLGNVPRAAPPHAASGKKKKKRPLDQSQSSHINMEFHMHIELAWTVMRLKEAICTHLHRDLHGTADSLRPEHQCIAVNGVLVCDADSLGTILLDTRTVVCAIDCTESTRSDASSSRSGGRHGASLDQLRSMGFSTKQSLEALDVSKNSLEGAVAFLTEGIRIDPSSSHEVTDVHLAEVAMTKPYYLHTAIQSCNPDHLVDISLDRMTTAMQRRHEQDQQQHSDEHDFVDVGNDSEGEETKDDDVVVGTDGMYSESFSLVDINAQEIALERVRVHFGCC
ncbi:hypothetical protein AaE_000787 [Aphanomyces astaci]|uniref:UBA domain-containing protein n=1 Tax=Aphanomyces astaci TaxID=112090 RepID=A0A6A5AY89_APHAT|nr:hypothetical protein AaE_000787 [Aphanomyces astaci]